MKMKMQNMVANNNANVTYFSKPTKIVVRILNYNKYFYVFPIVNSVENK